LARPLREFEPLKNLLALLVVPADAIALAATCASVVIAITGGGSFHVGGHLVRAHSVGNALAFLSLWAAARYASRGIPLFLVPALHLHDLPERLLRAARVVADALQRLSEARARMVLYSVLGAVALVKVLLVAQHPGFFGGDDVEIHEMTLGVLFGVEWPVWDLRSAFYPMTFIYPAQWLATRLGFAETSQLVVAGRLVVVALSTVTVVALYKVAARRVPFPYAMVAAVALATASLHVEFGASELPRSISALFVLGAYAFLTGPLLHRAAATAGVLLGVAACLRFSEIVFLLPAVIHLGVTQRFRYVGTLVLATTATAGVIQFLSDLGYWGTLFGSALAIIDFTLVDQLSSRGYEPWWFYARHATSWTDILVLSLAIYGTRRNILLAVWVWTPLLALSVLAHKEPRYLLPIYPLLSLLAAQGLASVVANLQAWPQAIAKVVVVCLAVAVPLRFLDQVSKYHIVRSDREVNFAQSEAPSLPREPVMMEQAWRFGGHLYLGNGRSVIDIGTSDPATFFERVTQIRPALVVISSGTCDAVGCESSLLANGLVEGEGRGLEGTRYRVFRRRSD
jgi:hypothetical protein